LKNLKDIIQAGRWLGFFKFQADALAMPFIEDLNEIPQNIKDDYIRRLGLIVGNLHPIMSVKVAVRNSKQSTAYGVARGAPTPTPSSTLISVLSEKGISAEAAEGHVLSALTQTQANIKGYLEIVKQPYQ